MGSHTPAAIDALCRQHLSWAQSYLRRKLGAWAEDHAGAGLYEAARTFDPERGVPFQSWASRVLVWTARRAASDDLGDLDTVELQDGDQSPSLDDPPATATEDRQALLTALRKIDEMPAPVRWVVLARFMANMTTEQIAALLGRHPSSIARTMRNHRRSMPILDRPVHRTPVGRSADTSVPVISFVVFERSQRRVYVVSCPTTGGSGPEFWIWLSL
mgnify:CR=1 FL=1